MKLGTNNLWQNVYILPYQPLLRTTTLPSNQVMTSSKISKCSDRLKIWYEQRAMYVGFKYIIHNGVAWGRGTVEELEPRPSENQQT